MASVHRLTAASARASLRSRTNTGYVCLNCQLRALSTSRKPTPSRTPGTLSQSRHYARKPPDDGFEGSFADRLRKKIWGTDNPPGQRNPYVVESPEEREDRLREQEEREAAEMEEADFERIRQARADDVAANEQDIVDDATEGEEEELDAADEATNPPKDYVPASTWRGLRHIPGWKVAQAPPKPWFQGFLAPKQAESPEDIERAIQRAVIEVWVYKQAVGNTDLPRKIEAPKTDFEARLATGVTFNKADRSLHFVDPTIQEDIMRSLGLSQEGELEATEAEEVFEQVSEDMIEGGRDGMRSPKASGVHVGSDDSVPLVEGGVIKDLTTGAAERVIAAEAPSEETEEIQGVLPPADPSYRQVAFNEPEIKFAVIKRVMQLTGTRIPDPVMPRLNNAADLLLHLIKPPPAKKLVDNLLENEELLSLPNLQVYSGKYGFKDKEEEVGRWKLIQAELARRGLPSERSRVEPKRRT